MGVGGRGVAGGGGEMGDRRKGVVSRKGIEMELGGRGEGGGREELALEGRVVGRVVHLVWTVMRGGGGTE